MPKKRTPEGINSSLSDSVQPKASAEPPKQELPDWQRLLGDDYVRAFIDNNPRIKPLAECYRRRFTNSRKP